MSVNLNLSFEIHELQDSKRKELIKEAKKFLDEEGLLDQDMIIDFLGLDGYLAAYTTYPVVISRSYVWVPDVTRRWQEMALRVNEAPCRALVSVDYPDEEV